jgi:hypothetical protein
MLVNNILSKLFFFQQVSLKVQKPAGLGLDSIEMVCSVQELQDLVARLKDARNNLEKIVQ